MTWVKDIIVRRLGPRLQGVSVVFSWDLPKAYRAAEMFDGETVFGGPAAKLAGIDACDYMDNDWLAMHNPEATFTTRGCPNSCGFCAVPKLEPTYSQLDLRRWTPKPVICDNNLTAATRSHFIGVIDRLVAAKLSGVDFTQGLDARLFRGWHADELARLPRAGLKIRFALDDASRAGVVKRAIDLCRERGVGKDHLSVYCLIGYRDDIDEAVAKLDLVRSWGVRPWPMRYQPLDCREKNSYVGPGWTSKDIARVIRYYAHLRWFEHIPFADYQGGQPGQMDLPLARAVSS